MLDRELLIQILRNQHSSLRCEREAQLRHPTVFTMYAERETQLRIEQTKALLDVVDPRSCEHVEE